MENQIDKLIIFVDGMTCTGCEYRIVSALEKIEGVKKVRADFSSGKVTVSFNPESTGRDELFASITAAGYTPHDEAIKKGVLKKEGTFTPPQLIGVVIVIAALYLLLKETGILNFAPRIDASMSIGILFITGVLTSIHCIGMCGGINLSQSVCAFEEEKVKFTSRLKPGLAYNLGRVLSYTVIGGIVGGIGSIIAISDNFKGWVVLFAGAFMILFGLNMLGIFPFLSRITPRLPKRFVSLINSKKSGKGPFVVGLLNGFMPCGPLQSMQIYALGTGSIISGALSMFAFSLGTVPLMLGLGAVSAAFSRRFNSKLLKISAMLVLLLGVGMLGRGFNLSGIPIPSFTGGNIENVQIASLGDGIQEVRTTLHASEYEPIIVQAGVPVRWTIYADEADINSCNSPMTVPAYDITKDLVPGENIIEFIPGEAGSILYTCWMGMIDSSIQIVDDIEQVSADDVQAAAASSKESSCGSGDGGCCGGSEQQFTRPDLDFGLPAVNHDEIGIASIDGETQIITVTISEDGIQPGVIVLQAGVDTQWNFNMTEMTEENYRLDFPVYGVKMEVKEGLNVINLTPEMDFTYNSWQGHYNAYVRVVENIAAVDLDEVRNAVEAYSQSLLNVIPLLDTE